MEKKTISLDKLLKISIAIGIILLAVSLFYYFLIRPFSKDYKLNSCLKKADKQFEEEVNKNKNDLQNLYAERSAHEYTKNQLEDKERELVESYEEQLKEPQAKKEMEDKITAEIKRIGVENIKTGYAGWGSNNSLEEHLQRQIIERSVKREFYNRHSDYIETTKNLKEERSIISELNKRVSEQEQKIDNEELKNKNKENRDFCFKRY